MSNPASTEVISPAEAAALDLRAHAAAINETLDLIVKHEDTFEESTLEPRLLIGLEIAKAQEQFGMTRAEAGTLGGRPSETLSRRDTVPAATSNPLGFSAWLVKEIPRLKRPVAYKYATAFLSLGVPTADATPALIRAKVKDIRHHCGKNHLPMPTLASLYKAGKPQKNGAPLHIEAPDLSPQTKLEDAREFFHLWREQFETAVRLGQLDDLDKPGLLEMKEFIGGARDRINARLK